MVGNGRDPKEQNETLMRPQIENPEKSIAKIQLKIPHNVKRDEINDDLLGFKVNRIEFRAIYLCCSLAQCRRTRGISGMCHITSTDEM